MWSAKTSEISGNSLQIHLFEGAATLSYDRVLNLWQESSEFRQFWSSTLIEIDWIGLRWETPPITIENVGRDFECILLRSDRLERAPDRAAFGSHFSSSPGSEIIAFKNLGGDAELIVPCPTKEDTNYVHLAAFLRTASTSQAEALWSATSIAMRERISDQPVWLSTAGMGVAWLHVRLDSRPKYYGHAAYRSALSN